MRIDAIEVYYVKNHIKSPWITAYGEDSDIYSVFVKMISGKYCGWSETSPLYAPTFSSEFAYGVYHLATKFFAPMTIDKDISNAKELNSMLAEFKGNPFAKSTMEIAWWLLKADMEQKPLHQLLGGTYHEIDVGSDFGITEDINELLENIQGSIDAGFKRVKLKVKPGKDIDVLKAVRGTFPNFTFHIDCNSGYTLDDLQLFKKIDKLGLAMIEQPLFYTDLHDHAILQAQIDTPVCLDESCNSVYAAKKAIELGSCRFMNIKPSRVGGLSNSIEIIKMCKDAGIGNWIGGMLETSIGVGICIELATLSNMTYPNDIVSSDKFYNEEISLKKIEYSNPGKMLPSNVAGIPYKIDKERLRQRTIHKECISSIRIHDNS